MEIHLRSMPGSRVRLLAWAASEAGRPLPDLLGEAPGKVDADLAQHVWSTSSQLARQGQLWQGWPLPLVEVSQVLMKDNMLVLMPLDVQHFQCVVCIDS